MADIPRFWRQRGFISFLLLPLSWLFSFITRCRKHWIKHEDLSVKIAVVGNISIGGNGKTPVVIALAKALKARGISVAVVSRGYGGTAKQVTEVSAKTSAMLVGDEPKLIWQQAGCPVVVGKKRCEAIKRLLSRYPDLDWIISDDGLQHYHMPRDIEFSVIAPDLMLGNGFLFPAGPLREPLSRLNSVDAVLYSGEPATLLNTQTEQFVLTMKNDVFVNLEGEEVALEDLKKSSCVALTAIARPQRFFSRLEALDLTLTKKMAFPDHANLPANLSEAFTSDEVILITGKDAVKLDEWKEEQRKQCVILNYEAILPDKVINLFQPPALEKSL